MRTCLAAPAHVIQPFPKEATNTVLERQHDLVSASQVHTVAGLTLSVDQNDVQGNGLIEVNPR